MSLFILFLFKSSRSLEKHLDPLDPPDLKIHQKNQQRDQKKFLIVPCPKTLVARTFREDSDPQQQW